MNPTTIALIVLGITVLVCIIIFLVVNRRRPTSIETPVIKSEPIPPKPPVLIISKKPQSEGYHCIYSYIPGKDRIICPNCGAEYDRSASICSVCGQRLS